MKKAVQCQAVVDCIWRRPLDGGGLWKVTVTGLFPHAVERVYTVMARDDNFAAEIGLNNFSREFDKLLLQPTTKVVGSA